MSPVGNFCSPLLRQVLDELNSQGGSILSSDLAAGTVQAILPAQNAPPGLQGDELVLQLRDDGTVLFRSESRSAGPDPPFCWRPGCISGPANRARMEALRDALGWRVLETDEEKQWVQILLH
jgi:hypothetical protein